MSPWVERSATQGCHARQPLNPGGVTDILDVMILRDVFHGHHQVGFLHVLLEFFERLALGHDFRMCPASVGIGESGRLGYTYMELPDGGLSNAERQTKFQRG